MNKINKTGMLDDVFDFLFFIFMLIVILFFFGPLLALVFNSAEQQSLSRLSAYQHDYSRITGLKLQIHGKYGDIDYTEKVVQHLQGKITLSCSDYKQKEDCLDAHCQWDIEANQCYPTQAVQ